MNYKSLFALVTAALSFASMRASATTTYVPSTVEPPPVQREFRAAWVATVGNIDWPSKPGLPVAQQKEEFIAILDRAVQLKLNAIVFQVRPACDAMYASKIEPWCSYLTGTMGQAPSPFYDPLEFAVAEAHKRGLELHAWFNPYRAGHPANKSPISARHISKTHPKLVRKYGEYLWLDPGEKEVQEYSLRVVMDIVNRYDIDGIQFDDYAYPYKIKDKEKHEVEFPDDASWKRYGAGKGFSREDWRRENVNSFVHLLHQAIRSSKPWVKFGISPFGIWEPHNPPQIKGMGSYSGLYFDSRKWLTNGWIDYCAPQLYWAIDPPDQSFPVLMKWWLENNPLHRNLWIGINSEQVGGKWKSDEIVHQIKITRALDPGATGVIQWSMKCLMENKGGLTTALENTVYTESALIPPSPWMEDSQPGRPKLTIKDNGKLSWKPPGWEKISEWVVQTKQDDKWQTQILPGGVREITLPNLPQIIAVTPVDRCNVSGQSAILRRMESK